MKTLLIISLFTFVFCYNNSEKSDQIKDCNSGAMAISEKNTSTVFDAQKNELSGREITITVSYAALACSCPQWFETKFKEVEFLAGIERFYLEPVSKKLINANNLWDGEHLPLTIKITGRFSKEKEKPVTYFTKGTLERARIFWYNEIKSISSSGT